MKVKIVSLFAGVLSIRPNSGLNAKPISLAGKKTLSFKNETEYANYSECVSSFKLSGLVNLIIGDDKATEPTPKVVEPPKAETTDNTPDADVDTTKAEELKATREKLKSLKAEFDKPKTTKKRKTAIKKEVASLKKAAKELK